MLILVVSPLIALMRDQVDTLTAKGISAARRNAEPQLGVNSSSSH